MATSTIVLIVVVAVAAILLTVGFVWVARTKRNQYRHVEADKVRGAAKEKTVHVSWQDALAEETAVKARAAQAEADVKAAQASGLQQQAAAHRNEATTSRAQLNDQWDRANALEIRAHRHPTRRSRPTTMNLNTTGGLILEGWTRTSDGDGVASSMSWPSAVNVALSSSTKADRTDGAPPGDAGLRAALQRQRVGYDIERGEGEMSEVTTMLPHSNRRRVGQQATWSECS